MTWSRDHIRLAVAPAVGALVWHCTLAPAIGLTATPTAPPLIQTVRGTVLAPGQSGLSPVAGIQVDGVRCDVSSCLDAAEPGASTDTTSTGEFSFALGTNGFIVVRATIDADVLRALVYDQTAASVDPIAEAMVRLLAEREVAAYGRAQLRHIENAVRQANGTADFSGLTIAEAVALALFNARADAAVDAALQTWTPTPAPTGTATLTATPTPSPYPAAPTATARPCVGDCDRSGVVTANEIVAGVRILLGAAAPALCTAYRVPTVADLVHAVANAFGECVPPPALPDLAVDGGQSVYVYGAGCTASQPCGVACVVNLGNADAAAFEVLFGARARLPELPAGKGQCLHVCDPALPFTGTVRVDPDDAIAELDEDNNAFAFSYPTPTPSISCP